MTLFSYFILFGTALCGGLSFLLFKKNNPIYLKLTLAFSGAFLFSITVLHLIPDAYSSGAKSIGWFILGGFLLQIFIEFFSEGIEHGHIHVHTQDTGIFPYPVMLGLCIHSFFEGMPIAVQTDSSTRNSLISGIILHHVPVAFALMSLLVASGVGTGRSVFFLSVFCLMTPWGAFSGEELSVYLGNSELFFKNIMGLVIGIFLHISTTILFESGDEHRFNLYKMATILAGVGLSILTMV